MSEKQSNHSNLNILLLIGVAAITFILLGARFFQLNITQSSHGEDLVEYIEDSQDPRSSIIEAKRGTIYDIQGQPIAIDTTSYSMYAVLQGGNGYDAVEDRDYTAKVLSNWTRLITRYGVMPQGLDVVRLANW